MHVEILFHKNFIHVVLWPLADGAGYIYIISIPKRHVDTGKNTLAGVDDKFEHTLFTCVQMSANMICKGFNSVVFNFIKNSITPVV